jgi:hypothetical protein
MQLDQNWKEDPRIHLHLPGALVAMTATKIEP